jgi:hypothetical protein
MIRTVAAVFATAVVWLACLQPLLAISPSYVMLYGGDLARPVLVSSRPGDWTRALWAHPPLGRRDGVLLDEGFQRSLTDDDAAERRRLAERLTGRPFLKFAVFWGRWDEPPVSPGAASQHGRLYLSTTEPSIVVATAAAMQARDGAPRPQARPVPVDLEAHRDALGDPTGFVGAWVLSAAEVGYVESLVPRSAR